MKTSFRLAAIVLATALGVGWVIGSAAIQIYYRRHAT